MARKRRKGPSGFHTPFVDLSLPVRQEPAEPESRNGRRETPDPEEGPEALFAAAMEGVEPLKDRDARVPATRSRRLRPPPDEEAEALRELRRLVEGKGQFRLFDSEEAYSGLAPGVSFQVLDRLHQGHFAFRRHLDLHGLSRPEAKAALETFIHGARRDGERCVLVVTGRGRRSPGGISVLRETLPRWLSRAPLSAHVLAFATATPVDGGPGAFYLLLRRPGVRPYGVLPPNRGSRTR